MTREKATSAQKRYRNAVENRLGPIWYRLVATYVDDLSIGTVETTFEIPAVGGKPHRVQLISNTGNEKDAIIAFRAIDQLRAPPIPSAVLAEVRKDYVVFEESFTIFPLR